MLKILPSIASADPLALRDEIAQIQSIGRLHLDIEDGNFIDNITFGLRTITAIAREFHGSLDAHLMTTKPECWLQPLAACGVSAICGHIEALPYPRQFLRHARSLGMKAGLAFNLKTGPTDLLPYKNDLDYVLVMTSEPDYGEQAFFECSFKRIEQFRNLLAPETELWCDGGICPGHLPRLRASGASVAVMGRAIFSDDNPKNRLDLLEREANNL